MKRKFLLFYAFLLCFTSTFAATFYVRTDGNNANSGTSNSSGGAWKTVKHAVSQLNTGDILLINDGYYFEPDEIKLDGKVGSNTNRITIKAINRRAVKIESNSLYHAIAIVNCTGVTIEGLEITFQANTRSVYHGMNLDGSNRITVKDCWVHDAPFSGIQGNQTDNIIIENCLITDNCKGTQISENGSGISIAASANRETNSGFHHILRNNIIYENEATSNVASTGSPTDGNGIIFDFNNENGSNFTYQSLVENNLVYKNGGRAIHVFGSRNVTIRNNTCFYNNYILDQYGWYNGEIQVEGPGCSIYNNIAVQDPSLSSRMRAIKIFTPTPPPSQNNLFVGNIEGTLGSPNILYTTGSQANVNFVNASTNPAVANFRLQANSPAVNAGNNSVASANDLEGITRPVGGTVDIGCYEYGGAVADTQAPTVPASLTSASVTQTSFTLNWAASTDAVGVTGYEVFRGGVSIGTPTSTTFSVTGLTAGTAYSMTVRARDAAGNFSAQSTALSVTTSAAAGDTQAPTVPTTLTSTNVTPTSFTLNWVASTDAVGVTGYEIFRGGTSIGTSASNSFNVTGLTANTAYSMTVRARDAVPNWSAQSTALSVTTSAGTGATNIATTGVANTWNSIPSATSTSDVSKSANTAINDGNTTVEVVYSDVSNVGDWQAAGIVWATAQPSITSIKYYNGLHLNDGFDNGSFTANMKVQSTTNGTTWTDVSGWTISPSYPYTSAASNQTYTLSGPAISNARGVRVVGQVRTNDLSWSIKVKEIEVFNSAAADTQAPTVPASLTSTNKTQTSFTLNWVASLDAVGVTGYEVFRGGVSIGTPTSTTFNVTGLAAGTAYSMTVRARDAAGNWSAQSTALSVTTSAAVDTQAPTVPTTLTSASVTQTTFTLNWAASTDAVGVTGYEVFRGGVSIGTPTSTTFNVTGLTAGIAYSMTVRARDAAGNWSAQSTALSVTTSAAAGDTTPPTVPASLTSASVTQTTFTLNWAASTDAVGVTGYQVYRGGVSIGTPTSTTFNVTGLAAGTAYSMTVRARDAAGNWSAQSTALSVTTSAATGGTTVVPNAVMHLKFNETTGTYLDDLTTFNNNGTRNALASFATTGIQAGCLNFTGVENSDVTVPSSASLSPSAQVTVSIWYNAPSTTTGGDLIMKRRYDPSYALNYTNQSYDRSIKFKMNGLGEISAPFVQSSVGVWHMATGTYDGVTMKLYLDGVLVTSQARTGLIDVNGDDMWIGSSQYGGYFKGRLDEARVYSRALTASEISSIYSTTSTTSQASANNELLLKTSTEDVSVAVYPNPASNSFNVSAPSDKAKITITALNGKVIESVNANAKVTTINSGNWAAGVYLIQVQAGAQSTIKKVIIVK